MHPKGAYFTRGSGHTQYGGYTEDSTEYQIVLDRLKRKFDTAKTLVPKAVFDGRSSHDVGIVSLGSCDGAVREALDILKRRGVQLDYMRVRSFPFGAGSRGVPRLALAAVRRRAESRRAAARAC